MAPRTSTRTLAVMVGVSLALWARANAFAQTASPSPPEAAGSSPPPTMSAPPAVALPSPRTTSVDKEQPPLGIFPTSDDALMDPRMARSWGALPGRPFVSTTFDVGFVYLRPRVALGYGRPFTSWFGIEANPIVTSDELAVYGGLHLEVPFFNLRVGPRFFRAFSRTYLNEQASYTRLELETSNGPQASAITYEAEVDFAIPAGPGDIVGRGSLSYVTGVPSGQEAFEETLRVVVKPPWIWRGRLGYAFRFGAYDQHSIGLIAEALDVPMRSDSVTVRAGPLIRFVLSRRVELRGSFVLPIVSPDTIGIIGGDFAELGVRYRWATE